MSLLIFGVNSSTIKRLFRNTAMNDKLENFDKTWLFSTTTKKQLDGKDN